MTKDKKYWWEYDDSGEGAVPFKVFKVTSWHENGKTNESVMIAECFEESDVTDIVAALNMADDIMK